ncbi:Gfo/Idh/MocA family oxidoreductase [Hydrogenoanaerobacterium sp.]|uniref:Gfo/Idh/MocA family protein n=1 Tax=Hydrogenoanaerobacterium sp. TaxID=2953763 RepID=UPI002898E568|nr:Gfo/Idh/MocA family oxidoreductase [Hydrogenoanaerobacterium sp.]
MLKIGIVGVGGMGIVHISNYAHIEGCKVVALCDVSEQAKQKAQEIGAVLYTNIGDMLTNEELDIVDVCTPTFMHREHVFAALHAGANVICEKPVALKIEDARAMFALAKEKGVRLFVAQVLRFFPTSKVLYQLVKSGEYGKLLDGTFERLSACPRWVKGGWLFDKTRSGHIPYDLHIHDLDLIVSLLGKPQSYSFTSCGNADKDYKEQYRFQYGYGDNCNIVCEAAWFNADIPFTAKWRVYFENAVVVNDGETVTAYQFDHEPRVFDTEEKIKIPTGINVPPTGTYFEELSHFTNCIKNNVDSDMFTEEQILTVMEILSEISDQT